MLRCVPVATLLATAAVLAGAGAARADVRTLDGSGNNAVHSTWGQAGTQYLRVAPPNYADGIGRMVSGPSPRYLDDDGYRGGFGRNDIEGLLDTMDANYRGWSSSIAPAGACVLNVADDHVDWHGSFGAYRDAKARLLRFAPVAVATCSPQLSGWYTVGPVGTV